MLCPRLRRRIPHKHFFFRINSYHIVPFWGLIIEKIRFSCYQKQKYTFFTSLILAMLFFFPVSFIFATKSTVYSSSRSCLCLYDKSSHSGAASWKWIFIMTSITEITWNLRKKDILQFWIDWVAFVYPANNNFFACQMMYRFSCFIISLYTEKLLR